MLAFRPWWRIVSLLGVLALVPLAVRGVERETPILIQQVASDPRTVPPAVAELTPRLAAQASRPGLLVAEAAGEPEPDEGTLPQLAAFPDASLSDLPHGPGAGPSQAAATPCPDEGRAGGEGGADEKGRPGETGGGARINLNTADAGLLQTLPGIGPALARRIIEYRERWGPFTDPRQLLEVSGIGEKRLEQLLPWVTVE